MQSPCVTGRLHLNGFGAEADQPARAILVPGCRQPLVGDAHPGNRSRRGSAGDAPGMFMLWAAWPVRTRLSSCPRPGGGRFRCSRAFAPLAAAWPRGQAGHEETGDGRDPVAAAAFAPDPNRAGQGAPGAVGEDMGKMVGVARCPSVADPDAAVIRPDRFRMVVEAPGLFQGKRVLRSDEEALAVFPDAQHRVGCLLPGPARNRLPAAHGVKGHNPSRQDRHAPRGSPDAAAPGPGRGRGARSGRRSVQRQLAPGPESPPRTGTHPAARRPAPAYPRGARSAGGDRRRAPRIPGRFRARACRRHLPCSTPKRLC